MIGILLLATLLPITKAQVVCTFTNALTPNTAGTNCTCGTTECTSFNGMYCKFSTNTCSSRPPNICLRTKGNIINSNDCQCGTTDCKSLEGLYCNLSSNTCSLNPACLATEAKTANAKATCANLPGSMNGGTHPNGCPGAVYSSGAFSHNYCQTNKKYPWWQECCIWENGSCQPKKCTCGLTTCTSSTGMYCKASSNTCSLRPLGKFYINFYFNCCVRIS